MGGETAGVAPGGKGPSVQRAEFVLVLVTLVWGGTFLVSQIALDDAGPFGVLVNRFGVAAATLSLLFRDRMRGLTRAELWGASIIGVTTFVSYALHTIGLQYIPSSKSAFITALYVPAVPLLQLVVVGVAPRISALVGIAVSFTGLLVLSSAAGLGIVLGLGEWLTVGGALTAALQIVLISRFAPSMDPMRLACLQLGVVAVLALVAMPIAGEPMPSYTPSFISSIMGLGVLGTAFGLGAMNWAQQTVSATRATVIYGLEPVWAGFVGAAAGEVMTARTIAGSVLIVMGVFVSETPWGRMFAWLRGGDGGEPDGVIEDPRV